MTSTTPSSMSTEIRRALVVRRGARVWDEVAIAKAMSPKPFDAVICVNVAGVDYPEDFDHWVTFHPEFLPTWIAKRRQLHREFDPARTQLWSGADLARVQASRE